MSLDGLTPMHFAVLPISALAFIVLLTIIVFFHEYGHFSVARLFGIKVDVFSIGFGKVLWRWVDRKGTEWRISMIPLGGFVKFFGDANAASQPAEGLDTEEKEGSLAATKFPRSGDAQSGMTPAEKKVCFHFKPVGVRAAVVAAGPIANFVLAIAIFWGLFFGFGKTELAPVIAEVRPGTAAEEAGFLPGDRIISIDGRPIANFDEVSLIVKTSAGETLEIVVERGGERLNLTASPRRTEIEDAFGNPVRTGVLGISGDSNAIEFRKFTAGEALKEAVDYVWSILKTTVKFLGRLILGKEDASQLGGPIKMAQYAGQAAMSGFDQEGYSTPVDFWTMLKVSLTTFINLAAVVSVSIGFLNLLPVPVLDGGHLLYYGYEAVAGKPLGPKAQAMGFRLGLVLLAGLMIFVTWNDINNILSLG
jgi:regulator of sigma E protease